MLGVVDDLLWSLRRAGLAFATPQALDVARVVAAVMITSLAASVWPAMKAARLQPAAALRD